MSRLHGALGGGALALIAAGMLHLPFKEVSPPLLALFLALTACVYPGALLAQRQKLQVTLSELTVMLVVFLCAFLGTIDSIMWLAAGYAIHGLWDWLHDAGILVTRVSIWFPPACAVFDFIIAAFVVTLL